MNEEIGLLSIMDNLIVLENGERYSIHKYINKLQQENKQLKKKYENAVADYEYEKSKNQRAIEILKLCNSKCSKETIEILKGENNER